MGIFKGNNQGNHHRRHEGPQHYRPRSYAAESYWDRWIASKLSKDQKVLLAEHMFAYLWKTEGKEGALNQVLNTKQQLHTAKARFDRGCQLWGQENHGQALTELRHAQAIQQAYSWIHEKSEIQLHYAMGTIHIGRKDYRRALEEFRLSWRLSGQRLGTTSVLAKSAKHMVGTVLSLMGFGIMEVHCQMNIMKQCFIHEKEADFLHSLGDLEMALQEYHCSLPDEEDTLEAAAVRCKMAIILEQKGNCVQAGDEWASALTIYRSVLGDDHPATMDTMRKLTDNHGRNRTKRMMEPEL